MRNARFVCLALTLAATVSIAVIGRAEDPPKPKDDALDSLLEKLDAQSKGPEAVKKDEPPASSGEVETKDKALDSLLEKLGESPDKPSQDDRPKGRPNPGDEPPADPSKKAEPGDLKGQAKDLDEHLGGLAGQPKKKKDQGGDGSGPLAEVIKEMRDVESRLGKPDTGDETRKKQAEIVRRLERVLDQLRAESSQGQGKKSLKLTMQPGQPKSGNKPGTQPGTQGGNAPFTKAARPNNKPSLAGGKDEWGHLPPELRQEMENVFREEALPAKEELVRRYFLSLMKKSLVREE